MTANASIVRRAARLARPIWLALIVGGLVLSAAISIAWSVREPDPHDFGSFMASGRAAAEGLDPYGVYPGTFHLSFPRLGLELDAPNLNPPIMLLVFQPLSRFNPVTMARVAYGVSLAFYLAALALLTAAQRERVSWLRVLWALSLAGLWHMLEAGQVYAPLVLAAAGAWLLLERGKAAAAGVLIGLVVAVKPNFAVWPVLLLLSGQMAAAGAALAVAAAVSLAPVFVYGPGVYAQWLAASRSFAGILLPNGSLPSLGARFGLEGLGIAAAALLLAAMALWAWRRRPDALTASGLALVGALLASPLTWPGYTLFLLPALLGRRWRLPLRIAAGLLVVPVVLFFMLGQSYWRFVLVGSVPCWALLLVLLELGAEALAGHPIPAVSAQPADAG